ncbi:MAG TPA: DNA alkylation repair protein [Verrucomicrobiae bacterium]|nr:DNA alkylation repair protein [Verrucomicrobiae bacterium]
MTAKEIVKQLEALGTEPYRRVLRNHQVEEPLFGVKVEELKKIQKKVKKDHALALDLYDTQIYDAQYLAGLIADETQMTRKDLEKWLAKANGEAIRGTTVAWVAAESAHGRELALAWIDSKNEETARAGWATLGSLVAVTDDADLDAAELTRLLKRVEKGIHQQPNGVRSAMNGFVIALGTYVKGLTPLAVQAGKKIGPVTVDVGNTACKVPYSPDSIEKARKRGAIGKKRATARC